MNRYLLALCILAGLIFTAVCGLDSGISAKRSAEAAQRRGLAVGGSGRAAVKSPSRGSSNAAERAGWNLAHPDPRLSSGGTSQAALVVPHTVHAADFKPASAWHNAGTATPEAAFETMMYAAHNQDVDAMVSVLHLDPKGLAYATAYFQSLPVDLQQQFGSPERMVATLWIAPGDPTTRSSDGLTGFAVTDERVAYNSLLLATEWQYEDGMVREKELPFNNYHGAWQWTITPGIVAGNIAIKGSRYSR